MPNNVYGYTPQPSVTSWGGSPQPQNFQPNNIQVLNTTSREFAENYPTAPNTTVMFMNYNGRRLYIKTQHANGLSYDLEELVLFTIPEFQQLQASFQQPTPQIQNGNSDELLSIKERISKLESQLEELMK